MAYCYVINKLTHLVLLLYNWTEELNILIKAKLFMLFTILIHQINTLLLTSKNKEIIYHFKKM